MTTNYLEVVAINGHASIQDLGRVHSQHLGFSASGAADEYAFLSANKLIAEHQHSLNPKKSQLNCAAIEITLGQISFQAHGDCLIAITGADCQAKINNQAVSNWQCLQLNAGDIIEFTMPKAGLHSYLAIAGGVQLQENQQPWLGSFSQTTNEVALGFSGKPLTKASKVYFKPAAFITSELTNAATSVIPNSQMRKPIPQQFYATQTLTLRFIASPLFLKMTTAMQKQWLSSSYSISADSNRMGYRLHLQNPDNTSTNKPILSDVLRASCCLSKPVCYGMIQLPANEEPIILMKERQTMGGYPVLGTVMTTDLFRLSQMRPGAKVNFSIINVQQAQQQLRAFYQRFS